MGEREMPDPGRHCLVRVHAAGVCSSDVGRAHMGGAYHYPLVMGHEFAGVVERAAKNGGPPVGAEVAVFPLIPCRSCEACLQGRWAHCIGYDYFGSRRDGGFQEYVAVPPWNLVPLPADLGPDPGCLCEPVAVAAHATRKAPVPGPGATALVLGAGFIGMMTARLLADRGYVVSVADRNPAKLWLAEAVGLTGLSVAEALGRENLFSLVVEATGSPEMFACSVRLARPLGSVVWVGNITGRLTLEQGEVSRILRKELSIRGVWNSDYRRGDHDDWAVALDILARADWIDSLVTHRIGLEDLPRVLADVAGQRKDPVPHGMVKVVVELA